MFFGKFSFYSRFLFIGIFVLLPIFAKSEPCVFIPIDVDLCPSDYSGNSTSEQLKSMICPFSNLREAMADERMADAIAGKNVFEGLKLNDVVRLQKGVGLYAALNPLRQKINKTYKIFSNVTQGDFTLNITTYPAETKKDTCANHSTIVKRSTSGKVQQNLEELEEVQIKNTSETLGVEREISAVFGDYDTVEGKKPRHFELRKGQDRNIIICEASKNSLRERVDLYCGSGKDECERQMPPLCLDWDENNSEFAGRKNSCVNLDAFEKVSTDFFVNNMTMQNFCPDDCSYYVQLLQRVRKEEDGEHCTESHAIVHCGPKKTERKYNLNIKVVDDFCEDFNIMCVPIDSKATSESIKIESEITGSSALSEND